MSHHQPQVSVGFCAERRTVTVHPETIPLVRLPPALPQNTRCSRSAATQVTLISCHISLLTRPKPTKACLCLILTEVKGRKVSKYCWVLLIRQALPPPGSLAQGQHKIAFRVVGKVRCCQFIIFKRSIKVFRVFSHPHWLK